MHEVDFATDFDLSPDNLLSYREATGGRLPVSMLLIPIKVADTVRGVVELDNFNTVAAYTEEDQALVESLTQQIALALENARLYAESRRSNEELEQAVVLAPPNWLRSTNSPRSCSRSALSCLPAWT